MVTKRCRLSWLNNSALVYEPKCGGRGVVAGSQPMSTAEPEFLNFYGAQESIPRNQFTAWRAGTTPWRFGGSPRAIKVTPGAR
jgi:hypothetical protein